MIDYMIIKMLGQMTNILNL